jgi:hypothetical protein
MWMKADTGILTENMTFSITPRKHDLFNNKIGQWDEAKKHT